MTWKKHVDDFLKELLRLEGRGDHYANAADQNQCQGYHILSAQKDRNFQECCVYNPSSVDSSQSEPLKPLYRCRDCFYGVLVCMACLVAKHAYDPFHRVEVMSQRLAICEWINTTG